MDFRIFWMFLSLTQGEVKVFYRNQDADIIPDQTTVKIVENDDLTFNCMSSTGDASFLWKRNDDILSYYPMVQIQRVSNADSGQYKCQIRHKNTTSNVGTESKLLNVEILQPPSAILTEVPPSVLFGEVLSFTAVSTAIPEPTYEWRIDSSIGVVLSRNKTYTFTASSDFILVCVVQNRMAPTFDMLRIGLIYKYFVINVHYKAAIPSCTSSVLWLKPGDQMELSCYVTGKPDTKKWWTKEADPSFYWQGSKFVVVTVDKSYAGKYVFHAENTVYPANQSAITSQVTAEFTVYIGDVTNSLNTTSQCTAKDCKPYCNFEGSTRPVSDLTGITHSANTAATNVTREPAFTTNCQCIVTSAVRNPTGEQSSTNFTSKPALAGLITVLCIVAVALGLSVFFNIFLIRRKSSRTKNKRVERITTSSTALTTLSLDLEPHTEHHYTLPIVSDYVQINSNSREDEKSNHVTGHYLHPISSLAE